MNNQKEKFEALLRSTGRKGVDGVIEKLDEYGFFTAPASASHHLNVRGGLLEHSLNVCNTALAMREVLVGMDVSKVDTLPKGSVIIASLLHDVCKADVYRQTTKKQKNASGVWENVSCYSASYDDFPLGHGEKSVIRLMRWGLELTDEEIISIRWHMNSWELALHSSDAKGNYAAAKVKCPLLSLIQASDNISAGILEA